MHLFHMQEVTQCEKVPGVGPLSPQLDSRDLNRLISISIYVVL